MNDNSSSGWTCSQCTFCNHESLPTCEMCECPREVLAQTEQASPLTIAKEEEEKEEDMDEGDAFAVLLSSANKKKRRTMETKREDRARAIQALYREPEREKDLPVECTLGLFELCALSAAQEKMHVSLCRPLCRHYSQAGGYGKSWSCGYRNIQMLCSGLVHREDFAAVLFNRDKRIPHIYVLQEFIEKAWRAGFDAEGAAHFKHKLCGSSKYIGTTECAALLRYFRLRAVIVDFPSRLSTTQSTASSSQGKKREQEEDAEMGERIFAWVQRYFSSQNDEVDEFRSSLYFQHDGHSRSIMGVRWSDSEGDEEKRVESLIVFDPSAKGESIKTNLLQGNRVWQRQLFRERESFKKTEYQILYVAPGLMSDEEYERSKLLVGESEFAPIRSQL